MVRVDKIIVLAHLKSMNIIASKNTSFYYTFLMKFGKFVTKSVRLLTNVNWNAAGSRSRVGRPFLYKTDDRISKINGIIRRDGKLNIIMLVDMINIDKENVR